jgi:hypothetical protein
MGKEVSRTHANLLSSTGKGDISEGKERGTWIGMGSINIIWASGQISHCTRETKWEGKHAKRILEKLHRDNER